MNKEKILNLIKLLNKTIILKNSITQKKED